MFCAAVEMAVRRAFSMPLPEDDLLVGCDESLALVADSFECGVQLLDVLDTVSEVGPDVDGHHAVAFDDAVDLCYRDLQSGGTRIAVGPDLGSRRLLVPVV